MPKALVEFINTCPCCDQYGRIIKSEAEKYGGDVEVVIHLAGKDFGYLKKYGPVNKGTMIVNGKKKYETLSRDIISKAIAEAVAGGDS